MFDLDQMIVNLFLILRNQRYIDNSCNDFYFFLSSGFGTDNLKVQNKVNLERKYHNYCQILQCLGSKGGCAILTVCTLLYQPDSVSNVSLIQQCSNLLELFLETLLNQNFKPLKRNNVRMLILIFSADCAAIKHVIFRLIQLFDEIAIIDIQ